MIMSLLSIMNHNEEPLSVYVLTLSYEQDGNSCEGLSPEFANNLDEYLKSRNEKNSLKLIDASKEFLKMIPTPNLETRFTPGCMLRLFADLLPEIPSRILYLDNDVICRGDFSEFYNMDMKGAEVAGVLDRYGSWFFKRNILKRDYLNSGVLLLDIAKIRETGLFEKCRIRCRDKKMFMPDQSAINKLSNKKIIVPRKYNEQKKERNDTAFRHFTTTFRYFPYIRTQTVKPWNIDKLHDTLKTYEYDSLYEMFQNVKSEISQTEKEI